jgi:hypothetical protein
MTRFSSPTLVKGKDTATTLRPLGDKDEGVRFAKGNGFDRRMSLTVSGTEYS